MPKATYMYWQKRFQQEDPKAETEAMVKEVCAENPNFGYRRVCAVLRRRGRAVNKKCVQRIMRKYHLQVTSFTRKSRKLNTYRGTIGHVAPNLMKRRFNTSVLHQKIVTDTTEFKYTEMDENGKPVMQKLYLNTFMDLFNREIISCSVSRAHTFSSVMIALKQAIDVTSDCPFRRTFHSDQGWTYQMKAYIFTLKHHKIFQSMSRKGNCLDNSVMENFFSVMKQEMYYGHRYSSFEELESAILKYIEYYNNKRIKQKLNWLSPVEFKSQFLSA